MCVVCEENISAYGDAEARVSQGAAFLDKEDPNWATMVNKQTLNIASSQNCVLGQLYGEYTKGVSNLFNGNRDGMDLRSVQLGFNGGNWIMEDLRLAWIKEIDKRLNPVNPVPEQVPTKRDHILVA